jgi:signal transduction histidine kinase
MLNEEILELIVQDHGVGFELDASGQNSENKTSHGIGLLGMRERIEMLGGTMQIHSQPGQGTRLVATIHITGEYIDKRGKNDSSRNRG